VESEVLEAARHQVPLVSLAAIRSSEQAPQARTFAQVVVVVVVKGSQVAQLAAVVVAVVDTQHQERLEPARTSLGEVHPALRRSLVRAGKAGKVHFRPTAATLSTAAEELLGAQLPAAQRRETTAEVLFLALAVVGLAADFQQGRPGAPEELAEPRRSTQRAEALLAALPERREAQGQPEGPRSCAAKPAVEAEPSLARPARQDSLVETAEGRAAERAEVVLELLALEEPEELEGAAGRQSSRIFDITHSTKTKNGYLCTNRAASADGDHSYLRNRLHRYGRDRHHAHVRVQRTHDHPQRLPLARSGR
jgi:hypothetical protein